MIGGLPPEEGPLSEGYYTIPTIFANVANDWRLAREEIFGPVLVAITSWNYGAERIFGNTAEEVIGKPITILLPPDRYNEEPSFLERIRRGERIEHYETVRARKDGSGSIFR